MRCKECGHWRESFAVDGGEYGPVDFCPECRSMESAITDYDFFVMQLVLNEGMSELGAREVADQEGIPED